MHESDSDKAVAAHLHRIRLEGKSARTVYDRGLTLKRVAAALLAYEPPVPLLDATPEDLYAWRAGLKVIDATVTCYASHVISFYRWAVKQGLIAVSPAADLPVPPPPKRQPHPIADADLASALATAPQPIRIWLVLAAWCGLRAKEIALLKADCIRLRDDVPNLRITHTATKGRTERTIPLHPFAVAELGKADLAPSGPVFRKATNGKPWTPWEVSKLCCTHLHLIGIADPLHSLRHWFVTRALEVDQNLRAAQELAGHANIQTTAGYAAVGGSALARTVNGIPSPLEREAS